MYIQYNATENMWNRLICLNVTIDIGDEFHYLFIVHVQIKYFQP
jgi:hypothetical protein